jgi:hypothetical protein
MQTLLKQLIDTMKPCKVESPNRPHPGKQFGLRAKEFWLPPRSWYRTFAVLQANEVYTLTRLATYARVFYYSGVFINDSSALQKNAP